MRNNPRAVMLIVAATIAALVGVVVTAGLSNLLSPWTAKVLRDCSSLESFARDGEGLDKMRAAYLRQEIEACHWFNGDKPETNPAALPTTTIPASSAPTPTVTVTVTATPAATTAPAVDKNNPDNWGRYTVELISTRPTAEKLSRNSFGPYKALHPDFRGEPLDSLSAKQFVEELKYRMPMSPLLTSATGAAFEMWDESTVNDRIQKYLSDKDLWKADVEKVSKALDDDLKNGAKIVSKPAGTYSTTYVVNDSDGVPHFGVDDNVNRPDGIDALQLTNGKILRTLCGGQQYGDHEADAPRMPTPSPGMGRDHEGTPIVVVPPETSTPTPTGTSTSTPTSTPTTTPSPTPTPTPTTSLEEKDESEDPNQNGNSGNGGGQNEDSGPGPVTTPTQPPETPRDNPTPAQPTEDPEAPAPPDPEPSAPTEDNPAEGCSPAPGEDSC